MKIYLKLIGMALGLTVVVSLFTAFGMIFQLEEAGLQGCQIAAFLLAAIFFFYYMRRKDRSLRGFGFVTKPVSRGFYGYIALVVLVQPLIFGVNTALSLAAVCLIVVQMLLVGFVEEALFRGIFFYFLRDKGLKVTVVFSSVVFGLLHMSSGLNPEMTSALVMLQVVNALLVGVVFALLYYQTGTIYIGIVFHALFDILASVVRNGSVEKNLFAVGILTVCYVVFIIYTGKNVKLGSSTR
ncbi:CPBP family intramembrane metalloprotease [Enterococcus sp. 669A]|uniref:CPBP family intramembrane metalloprotease n=1 Tax=Candidatus Enterococcus moelleringii TaxID=2815325 RepID=A0ABS3LEG8_9ENTE|nr:CPBP family intramembrane glutamic endopeptidase [Enterococcus sp. 669A]MBO1308033.1 CPBP family intramembrane metalloprotease [Enterococcus sp. 669A]